MTAIWRLVVDGMRRTTLHTWPILAVLVAMPVLVLNRPSQEQALALGMILAMATSGFVGLNLATTVSSPVLRFLPVSSRQLWLAAWTLGTVVPTTVTTALILVVLIIIRAVTGHAGAPASWLLLACVITFVFLGALGGLVALRLPRWPGLSTAWAVALELLGLLSIVVVFLSPALGLLYPDLVPTTWRDLTGWRTAVLGIGAILTVVGALHVPKAGAPLRRRTPRAAKRASARALDVKSKNEWWRTGLTLAAMGIGRQALIGIALFLVVDATAIHSIVAVRLTPWPFLVPGTGDSAGVVFGVVILTAFEQVQPGNHRSIRHWRTLPLGDWVLASWMVAVPALQTVLWWLVLVVVHLAIGGALPAVLHPALFPALVGLGPPVVAMTYLNRNAVICAAIVVVELARSLFAHVTPGVQPLLALLVGALLSGGSAALVRHALKTSRTLYARSGAGLGRFRGQPRSA